MTDLKEKLETAKNKERKDLNTQAIATGKDERSSSPTQAKRRVESKKISSSPPSLSLRESSVKNECSSNLDMEEMARAGLHFGHRSSRIHPKMKPYLQGVRNTIHIISLEKTAEKLEEVLKFIKEIISQGKTLLLVGTKIQVKELVKETGESCLLPYVSERWLGGTFTNFGIIRKRIEYFKDLERKRDSGGLEKYTKKERAKIEKKIRGLERKFGGIKNLEKLPEVIFVLEMKKDELAIKEARKMGIKVISISDTNTDPSLADYFIPANDDAISSVKYILEKVKEVILKARPKSVK